MTGGAPIHVGTSGWHYDHWADVFYPAGLAAGERLTHYARHFRSVEINTSFYGLPEVETLTRWADQVPAGFCFAVKASRYITHMKKLREAKEAVATFLGRVETLGDRLGPIVFQLPPRWHANPKRLAAFLEELPGDHRYAFEFRDPTWFSPPVYDALRARGAAFCLYDLDGRESPREVTADFVYVRLHGPDGPYRGRYDVQALAGWAGAFSTWSGQGREVYCYFDNDEAGHAAEDALRLQEMAGRG